MKIGNLNFNKPLMLAPMEGVTDIPFRLICKKLGADLMFTEFVNAEALKRNVKKTISKMDFLEIERPFGIQIYGGNLDSMEIATKMATDLNPDLIDVNAGCWVKNVVGSGAGAALLKDLDLMKNVISKVVNATKIPVTVKTRLGWDFNSIQIIEIAKIMEDIGVASLTIHCRTRSQGHKGNPDFSWIPKIKSEVKIPIIVNGGLNSVFDVAKVFEETFCDGVMIARGAIEHPWIFRETKNYFQNNIIEEVTLDERIETLIEHLKLSIEYKGEQTGILEMRKHFSGYLKGISFGAKLRVELMNYLESQPILDKLHEFKNNYKILNELN